nr:MAG TPA: hypothetical protein [Caudoviricetes sp.]
MAANPDSITGNLRKNHWPQTHISLKLGKMRPILCHFLSLLGIICI